ncbi:DUF2642 domain-containing protein [Bacillus sp. AK128]
MTMMPMQPAQTMQLEQVIVVEPYVYSAVSTLVGRAVVMETSRGRVSGMIMDVKPDHVLLQERESTFFVRLCEIVWLMPDPLKQ